MATVRVRRVVSENELILMCLGWFGENVAILADRNERRLKIEPERLIETQDNIPRATKLFSLRVTSTRPSTTALL